jgi:hypothetical protein
MRARGFVAAAFIVSFAGSAWAIDDGVLGRDDAEFAAALAENGFEDLAEPLVGLIATHGDAPADCPALVRTRLFLQKAAARQVEDPFRRRDALLGVLDGCLKFVEEFDEDSGAVQVEGAAWEVCHALGETVATAILATSDGWTVATTRAEADATLQSAERWMSRRIETFAASASKEDPDDRLRLVVKKYCRAQTLYLHALIFERGSDRRVGLCSEALRGFDELDVDWSGEAPLIFYFGYVGAGMCERELGKTAEAVESFDKVIALRMSYGDFDEKTGVWPIPPEAQYVVDLVCYALLQKMLALRDADRLVEVVAVGKDYLSTTPRPFDAYCSMALARTLGDAQLALRDSKGAAETARRMIAADPDGVGARWGGDLLERCAK